MIRIELEGAGLPTYRTARVQSLFNAEGAAFSLEAEIPPSDAGWSLGVIVGPSGSGKTTLGKRLWPDATMASALPWPDHLALVDAIAPDRPDGFDAVTAALSSVGLGSVPAWLRPYRLLSNGERFRAELARILVEAPQRVVIDEFTSVVDRQIARVGAGAFAKAWRRAARERQCQAVLLTCHYDVLDWLEPDWVIDTTPNAEGRARLMLPGSGRGLRCTDWYRRPSVELEVREVDSKLWPLFAPHHYLSLPKPIAPCWYAGFIEGEPVAHVAISTRPGLVEARAVRLVVMPEWQGIGVGRAFLNAVCDQWRRGINRHGRPMPTLINTSHPGLTAALRRDPNWTQVSASLFGANRTLSHASLVRSVSRGKFKRKQSNPTGFGGHFRAIQGFRYLGLDGPTIDASRINDSEPVS